MKTRVVKVDEYQFLLCLKYKLWASNTNNFKKWDMGDLLIFTVNKQITALAEIVSEPFISDEILWDNGIYPHRIAIKFINVMSPEERMDIKGDIKEIFYNSWGYKYGWGILNQAPMLEDEANQLVSLINTQDNSLINYTLNVEELLLQAKEDRRIESEKILNGQIRSGERKFKGKVIDL